MPSYLLPVVSLVHSQYHGVLYLLLLIPCPGLEELLSFLFEIWLLLVLSRFF